MGCLNSRKKRHSERHSPICTAKNNHIVVSSIILAVIVLTSIAAPCFASVNSINWTEDELTFMDKHPVIRLGVDPGFVPFEFINEDGEYKGITADYLALIREKTGLQFEVIQGLTWPEVFDMALAGDIDVLPAIGRTGEREEYFLFSEPYYYYKRVIVTRDIDTGISGIDDLEGFTVAVQRNSSHHSYLLSYPKINLSLYDSVEAALTAVATGAEKLHYVLLAEDNKTNQLIAKSLLEQVGIESIVSSNGKEAVEQYKKQPRFLRKNTLMPHKSFIR